MSRRENPSRRTPSRILVSRSSIEPRLAHIGALGVYVYLIGFALPHSEKIPLITLVSTSIIAVFACTVRHPACTRTPYVLLGLFLAETLLSLAFSDDRTRSLWLSASLLPATLIFLAVLEFFRSTDDFWRLYFCLAITGLALDILLAWAAGTNPGTHPEIWATLSGSPIIITRNDLAFLSLLAPFPLALIFREPRSLSAIFPSLVIACSLGIVIAFQSRGATVSMIVALFCTAFLSSPRSVAVTGGFIVLGFLLVDAAQGFSLTSRFGELLNEPAAGRSTHWAAAWDMFFASPVLGHGPHTFALFHQHPWTHNLYLQTLAEQGILGLICLLALLAWGIRTSLKTRLDGVSKDIRELGSAVSGSLAGFCISSVVELSLLRHWVVIVFFTLLAVVARLDGLRYSQQENRHE